MWLRWSFRIAPQCVTAVNPRAPMTESSCHEIDPGLQNHLLGARRGERGFGLIRVRDLRLTLPS